MKHELTETHRTAVAALGQAGLKDIIRPLKQEIHLFDTFVAGTMSLDPGVTDTVKLGDSLLLKREECLFDAFRINIYTADGTKIGYIPEKDNVIFARLLDAGKKLTAGVTDIHMSHGIPVVSIGICLVDF